MTGQEFAASLQGLSTATREARVLASLDLQVKWPWCPVPICSGHGEVRGELRVASDVFAIGTPDDFVRIPLSGPGADMVAAVNGAVLPTSKISDMIWRAATVKLTPHPWGPPYDGSMLSLGRVIDHNQRIETDRVGRVGLIAGHKKDVVLSKRLAWQPSQVAIYGWHQANGVPIQPLSLFHEASYADYSHGARMVARRVLLDGVERDIEDVLADPAIYTLLAVAADGPLKSVRYPGSKPTTLPVRSVPSAAATAEPLLYLGMPHEELASEAIKRWQATLQKLRFGILVTGEFDAATDKQTRAFQTAHGLVADGKVGPLTRKAAATATVPPAGHGGPIPFVQAKHFTPTTDRPMDLIVIHSTEGAEVGGAARGVASWFGNLIPAYPAPQASAHYVVDNSAIVQCVKESDVAWHAPGANHNGVGIEHVGYARQSAAEWGDPYSSQELFLSAGLAAGVCARHKIPAVFVDAAGLVRGERGITTHAEVTKAFHGSSHTDPGPWFPMQAYLDMVRAAG